jgi:hypothetical protein
MDIKKIIREEIGWGDFEKSDEEELMSILKDIFKGGTYRVYPYEDVIRVTDRHDGSLSYFWSVPKNTDPIDIEEHSQNAYRRCYSNHGSWCNRGGTFEGYQITNDLVKDYFKNLSN